MNIRCDCGTVDHIEKMTIAISVPSGNPADMVGATHKYQCERCADWEHHFGNYNEGECHRCGDMIKKESALHFPNDNWGSFYCGDDCSIGFETYKLSYDEVDYSKADHSGYYKELASKSKYQDSESLGTDIEGLEDALKTAGDNSRAHIEAMIRIMKSELASRKE